MENIITFSLQKEMEEHVRNVATMKNGSGNKYAKPCDLDKSF